MASRSHAQAKLNTVVEVIGEGLDSEVCSIYLLREGMLELFATRGLAQEAVHVTRMAIGEGLVGTIAEQYRDAEPGRGDRPSRTFRIVPETGEDKFHFLRRGADRAARTRGGGAVRPACRSAPL
jgi:phosphotransferase system enzyme I (PtsP)